jgi:hypothetical protein
MSRAGILALIAALWSPFADQPPASSAASRTQVVLLGTGDPAADPDQSGPATAVVVDGTPYLVDLGAGVIRRAKAAVQDRGITN